jgi:hypothetical protein
MLSKVIFTVLFSSGAGESARFDEDEEVDDAVAVEVEASDLEVADLSFVFEALLEVLEVAKRASISMGTA